MGRPAFVRQRILEAAFDLFARNGYEATTTRDIATAARVGPASMYRHFPTKEDLGRELYRVALAPLAREFSALRDQRPKPQDAVRGAIAICYRAYDQRPRALALLVFPPHEFTPAELDSAEPGAIRSLFGVMIGGDDDLVAVVWGAITGPLQDRYLRRRSGVMAGHADAHAERIIRLLPDLPSVPPGTPS